MKKKLSLICLCGIILLGVCGCGKEETDDWDVYEVAGKIDCPQYDNAKYGFFSENIFIDENDNLYLTSYKKFSDSNTNCQKISDIKLVKFGRNHVGNYKNIVFDENNNAYVLDTIKLDEYSYKYYFKEYTFDVDEYFLKSDVILFDCVDDKYYVLKTDGKIYEYDGVLKTEKVLYEFEDEKILWYEYGGVFPFSSLPYYLITDKAYYTPSLVDENCLEYNDIKCEYQLKINNYLTKNKNNIAYIYSNIGHTIDVIFKNGKNKSIIYNQLFK